MFRVSARTVSEVVGRRNRRADWAMRQSVLVLAAMALLTGLWEGLAVMFLTVVLIVNDEGVWAQVRGFLGRIRALACEAGSSGLTVRHHSA